MICLYTTNLPSTNDDAQLNLPAKIMHLNQQNFNALKYQIYTFMFVLEQHGWIQLQLIGESSHSHTASAYICQLLSQYEFRKLLYFLCKSKPASYLCIIWSFCWCVGGSSIVASFISNRLHQWVICIFTVNSINRLHPLKQHEIQSELRRGTECSVTAMVMVNEVIRRAHLKDFSQGLQTPSPQTQFLFLCIAIL